MDYKNPVFDTGDGVLHLGYPKLIIICFDDHRITCTGKISAIGENWKLFRMPTNFVS